MKTILIPTDFSETTENAVNYGLDMANHHKANVVLMHINQIPASTSEFGISAYNVIDVKENSLELLNALKDKITQTHPSIKAICCCTEIGSPEDLILNYAKENAVDIVVMGNSGYGSHFAKNLFGSTSVSVSKNISIPVIIVPPNIYFTPVKKIAYGCDYETEIANSRSLEYVQNICTDLDSNLNIVHIMPEDGLLSEQEAEMDYFVEDNMQAVMHKTYIIKNNNVSDGLIEFITEHNIDLIIVEPKKHSLFHTLFHKSVINELAFFSPIPVMAIHG